MKTNQVLKSMDRDLFGVIIHQETKNQFLSLTDLQKSYEIARWQYGWSERDVSRVMRGVDFYERVYHILNERGTIKLQISGFMEMIDKEGITNVLKGLGVYKTTGRGSNKNVMCDPYIWVLIAMEMNPLIYAKVVIWLTDSLIFNRMEAGSNYLAMTSAISKVLPNPNYANYATAINKRVFGVSTPGMRNLASAKELRAIDKIEQTLIQMIDFGIIKTEEQIFKVIEKANI